MADGQISVLDQMRISSVDDWVVLRIWNRVEPMMTKRKMPRSQGPTCDDSSFLGALSDLLRASFLCFSLFNFISMAVTFDYIIANVVPFRIYLSFLEKISHKHQTATSCNYFFTSFIVFS